MPMARRPNHHTWVASPTPLVWSVASKPGRRASNRHATVRSGSCGRGIDPANGRLALRRLAPRLAADPQRRPEIAYDLTLPAMFRRVKPPEEAADRARV